jgi:UDP-N-acetylmuramate--alanine ligase
MTVPQKAYFIGIGGIGMSGLAQLYLDHGAEVSGSDKEESPTTALLYEKGIEVLVGQKAENVPADVDVVVYTEAVAEDNVERVRAKEQGIRQVSYFQALGEISRDMRTIAVAGTHGKTTTTGMLAKILRDAGASPTAVIGSIVRDFGSNYLPGAGEFFVVEACEYKRDFLTLTPEILVVTNIEFDHSDYYKDLVDVQDAFRTLMEKTTGVIVADTSHEHVAPLLKNVTARVVDYTQEPAYAMSLLGEFNRMNARAASAASHVALPDLQSEKIKESLSTFAGAWRRFEYKGKTKNGADVYDDYAHHPTAVWKTVGEVRRQTQGKIFLAFHPHLYSRTRDLFEDFVHAFVGVDRLLIAPIYGAREVDDGSISSEMLAERIAHEGVNAKAATTQEIQQVFESEPQAGDVVITMGAGDIYKVADALVAH